MKQGRAGQGRGMSRRTFVAGATLAGVNLAVFGLAGCAPKSKDAAASGELSFKAGTYTGVGEGKFGPLELEVTFSGTALTDIKIGEHEETERVADRAFEEIPAKIIEQQALGIDTVTGCTLTSAAILDAVTDCVKQADGSVKAMEQNYVAPERSTEVVDLECDFVIAGAGAAGMGAAIGAAQCGATKVIVLEKGSNVGGNALVSGGYLEYVHAPKELRVPMTPELTNQLQSQLNSEYIANIDPAYVATINEQYAAYLASGDTTLFDSEELMALQEALMYEGTGFEGSLAFAQCVASFNAFR